MSDPRPITHEPSFPVAQERFFSMAYHLTNFTLIAAVLITLLHAASARDVVSFPTVTPEPLCEPVRACLENIDNGLPCDRIPVLDGTMLPQIPPDPGFTLTEHRPGVYTYFDGVYHTLMIVEGTHFVFVDFPDTPGSNIPDGTGTRLTAAADIVIGDTIPTRIDMVYSHRHLDHIGASKRFHDYIRGRFPDAEMPIYGTEDTRANLLFSSTERAIAPTRIIGKEGSAIELSNDLSINFTMIGGHSSFDLFSYIPRSNGFPSLGHIDDIVYPSWSPFENFGATSDFVDYMNAHFRLLEFDNIDVLSGGHVPLGSRDDVIVSLEYAESVIRAAEASVANERPEVLAEAGVGLFGDANAPEFGNVWFLIIDVVMRTRIDSCFRVILEEWGCRLTGLEFNIRSHCFTALNFLTTSA